MEISTSYMVLIPLVIGVVQVIKIAGLSKRYVPLASVILGAVGAIFLGGFDSTSLVQGVIAGLSASGLWSGGKAVLDK